MPALLWLSALVPIAYVVGSIPFGLLVGLAKGIDPRTFFQQMQDGADPADIQKQLLSQGLIDQKTLDQLQSNMLALTASRIKSQLGVTDADFSDSL